MGNKKESKLNRHHFNGARNVCLQFNHKCWYLSVNSKEIKQKESKWRQLTKSNCQDDGVCFSSFFNSEDESLIALWGLIISYNSSLRSKLSLEESLLFKNWLWRWIWSSGGKFLQFLTYLLWILAIWILRTYNIWLYLTK